ncbi:MAG: hypothetical protein AAFX55_16425, partial [Bacteroidota bacterium]
MKKQLDKILTIQPWAIAVSFITVGFFRESILGYFMFFIMFILFTYWKLRLGEELYSRLEDKSILSLKRFRYQLAFVVLYLFGVLIITDGFGYSIN